MVLTVVHLPTHTHVSEYADPVLRPPSPASSASTIDDRTPQSEIESTLVHIGRMTKAEELADREPLVTFNGAYGKQVWVWEQAPSREISQALHERVMASLTAEIMRIRENEIFERAVFAESRVAQEIQPQTVDVDALMRTMMGPSMDIGSGPYMGKNSLLEKQKGKSIGSGIENGPWNNFGKGTTIGNVSLTAGSTMNASESTEREMSQPQTIVPDASTSSVDMDVEMLPPPVVGKRSRNGTSRKYM